MVRLWIPLPIAIAAVVGLVAVAAVLAGPSVTGPAVVLVFFLLAPGFALVRLVEPRDPPLEAVLSVAISLALAGLVATAQAYFGAWSPSATVVILITITAGALVIHPVRAIVPRLLARTANWAGAAVTISRPLGKATAATAATAIATAGRIRTRAAGRMSLLLARRRANRASVGAAVSTPEEAAVIARRLASIPVAESASAPTVVRTSRAKSTDASRTTLATGSPRRKGAQSATRPRPRQGSKRAAVAKEAVAPESSAAAFPAPKKAAQRRSSAAGTANLTSRAAGSGPPPGAVRGGRKLAAASGPPPGVVRGAKKAAAATPVSADVTGPPRKATVGGQPTPGTTASLKRVTRKQSAAAVIAAGPKPARTDSRTSSRAIKPIEPKRQTRKAAGARTPEQPFRRVRHDDRNRTGEGDRPARPGAVVRPSPPVSVRDPRSSRAEEGGDVPPPPVAVIRRRPRVAEQQTPPSRRRPLGEALRLTPRATGSVRSAIEHVVDDLADLRDRSGKQ